VTTWIQRRFGCTGLRIPLPGRWQAELWLAPRGCVIPPHVHPRIDSRLVFLGGGMRWWLGHRFVDLGWRDALKAWRVPAYQTHGAETTGPFGLFLNLERWMGPKTSAAENLEFQ